MGESVKIYNWISNYNNLDQFKTVNFNCNNFSNSNLRNLSILLADEKKYFNQ